METTKLKGGNAQIVLILVPSYKYMMSMIEIMHLYFTIDYILVVGEAAQCLADVISLFNQVSASPGWNLLRWLFSILQHIGPHITCTVLKLIWNFKPFQKRTNISSYYLNTKWIFSSVQNYTVFEGRSVFMDWKGDFIDFRLQGIKGSSVQIIQKSDKIWS